LRIEPRPRALSCQVAIWTAAAAPDPSRDQDATAGVLDLKTIGLCMIVRNEAHVIVRCLASARPLVDYVLIEDTGSADGTQEIIRAYLRNNGIPGMVIEEPWRDFGYNRSLALKALRAHKNIDYALMIDADDVIVYDGGFDATAFKAELTADLYDVQLRLRDVIYERPQICSNRIEFFYRGVLHEFIDTADGAMSWGTGRITVASAHGFQIAAGLEGGRNLDPQKYRRDADILRRALKSEGNQFLRSRYAFYLASSLRDAGDKRRALEAFEERAGMGFWHEEVFMSLYNAGDLKAGLGHPPREVVGTYLAAFEACPTRLESLHGAVRFCNGKQLFHQAHVLAKGAIELRLVCPARGLFLQRWIYEYGLLDEFAVAAYWAGDYRACLDACEALLAAGRIPSDQRGRIEANAQAARHRLGSREA
jgi:glycosyltransferase involved in cell wall biosynthesis